MSIKAMKLAEPYIVEALARHDEAYERHPSTEPERKIIVEDLESLRQAIEQAELVQRAEEAFDRSEQYVMKNAQGELERISLVQTGVGIGIPPPPVAWMYDFLNLDTRDEVIRNWVTQDLSEIDGAKGFNVRPLYAATPQRQWVSLTEEEIEELMAYWSDDARSAYGGAYAANGEYVDIPDIIRDAEARLKEKNT